ncbi:MAG: DAK2 domain-containing protein [Lachnospiraceae bacterium]|nr:DAK2 domain-containing protein [Lachnospiraceae bacterium]
MEIKTIDGAMLQKMFLAGAKNLDAKKEWINELNVFPVPDGDTGTNMTMTIMSAAKEVGAIEHPDLEKLCKAISSGSLRGARGNSGVILSQLFRGFTKEIKHEHKIDSKLLAKACVRGVETAYKAVMKPKEGTILTVAKGIADKAVEICDETEDLVVFIDEVIKYGDEVLNKTPDMLPVLKQAGVVDSGGQGLMQVLKGAYDALLGKEIDFTIESTGADGTKTELKFEASKEADIKFGYCTEFIILLENEMPIEEERAFKSYLESIGDSIVVVADEDVVKVHVHTNDPGLAIQKALTYGQLSRMKIDNMREEHQERLIKDAEKVAAEAEIVEKTAVDEPRKPYGFVAVSVGEGLSEIFKSLRVDYIIEGGQTMNPSTEDVLNAIDKINADTIFVLPNNKNIIMAAQQAESLVEDKEIVVIPSKTIPQGIAALISFADDCSTEENKSNMIDGMSYVKSGQVTYAVRDTVIDDKEIKEGNIMGIGDSGIAAVGEKIDETTIEMIKEIADEDSEIVSVYYGADVTEEDANVLLEKMQSEFPDYEIEMYAGGQPVYYYLVSVE